MTLKNSWVSVSVVYTYAVKKDVSLGKMLLQTALRQTCEPNHKSLKLFEENMRTRNVHDYLIHFTWTSFNILILLLLRLSTYLHNCKIRSQDQEKTWTKLNMFITDLVIQTGAVWFFLVISQLLIYETINEMFLFFYVLEAMQTLNKR